MGRVLMSRPGDSPQTGDGPPELGLSDGSPPVPRGPGPEATTVSQTTADGTTFSRFDASNQPGHVQFGDGRQGDFTHNADGTTALHLSDWSTTITRGTGPDATTVSQTTADRTTVTRFDASNQPWHLQFGDR